MSSEPPAPSLDPCGDEFSTWMNACQERLARWLDQVNETRAHEISPKPGLESAERLQNETLPESGMPLERALDRVFQDVVPYGFGTSHPGYLAYVPGGGLPSAALGDLIASITNRYVGVHAAAPPAVATEVAAIRWLMDLCGWPSNGFGLLTPGGSVSTHIATVTAREDRLTPEELPLATAYYCEEAHSCVAKALRLAGVPASGLRPIPSDDQGRLLPDAVERALKDDIAAGHKPFFLCATAGTVNTGVVDDLTALGDLADRHGLWFHVDGAYGGMFAMVEELADCFVGLKGADSLVLDPHKGMFLAYGTGALLVKHASTLSKAHGFQAAYLPVLEQEGAVDFCSISPELSRDWRGLRLWLALKLHGASAFRDALGDRHRMAVQLAKTLAERSDIRLMEPPALSLFAFRQEPGTESTDHWNAHNKDLMARINADGRIMLTGTTMKGQFWIRVCVLHLRTDWDLMSQAEQIIRKELDRP